MVTMQRFISSFAAIALLALTGCAKDATTTQSATPLYCTVSSVAMSSTNQVSLVIQGYNGTGPYVLNTVGLAGTNAASVKGSQSFASTTTLLASFATAPSSTASGTVTIHDSSSSETTAACSFSMGSSSSSGVACTLTPSTATPLLNQIMTYTAVVSTEGTSPYTFSAFAPGNSGYPYTNIATSGSTATVSAYYTAAGVATPSITVSDSAGHTNTCTTSVTVQNSGGGGGGGGSLTCHVAHVVSGNTAQVTVTSTTGEPVVIQSISAGGASITTYGNPISLAYSTTGAKTISLSAVSATTGIACNGGAVMYDSFLITSGTTSGGPVCTAVINPNPSYAQNYVSAYAAYSSVGAGSPRIVQINYPTYSYLSGYYTGASAAQLYFPYSGSFAITIIVQDLAGAQSQCTTVQTVY